MRKGGLENHDCTVYSHFPLFPALSNYTKHSGTIRLHGESPRNRPEEKSLDLDAILLGKEPEALADDGSHCPAVLLGKCFKQFPFSRGKPKGSLLFVSHPAAMVGLNIYNETLYARYMVTLPPEQDNRMSHNAESFNKKFHPVQRYLLLIQIPGGYICPSADTTRANMRRRLSLAHSCAKGANREDCNPGPRSCPCRRVTMRTFPHTFPAASEWSSGRTPSPLLSCGVQ